MNFRAAHLSAPALAIASWVAGCSSASPAAGSPAPDSGASASVDGGVEAAAPSTLSNGCPMNSGFTGDDLCLTPPAATDGFQLHYGPTDYADPANVEPYRMNPSEETVDCYYLKTPNKTDVYVGGYKFYMRSGSHHLNINVNTMAQPDGFATCGANDMSPGLLFGSETPKVDELTDPAPENAGLASKIPANSQAVINFHVINTTSKPTLREAWLNYMFMDPSQVKGIRGTLFLVGGLGFQITPGTHQTYTYSCSPDRPVRVIGMAAHMHVHATRMTAWKVTGGTPTQIYETYDWSTPTDLRFDSVHQNLPANASTQTGGGMTGTLTLQPGDLLQWECEVNNTGNTTLTFRNEVRTGEMCIMTGAVVPIDDPMSPYDFTCTRN
jgi:hypothetical protein